MAYKKRVLVSPILPKSFGLSLKEIKLFYTLKPKYMNPKITKVTLAIIVLSILAVGYYFINTSQEETPLTEVNVQFKWVHAAQFAGFYMAKEKEFYADMGINPTFYENNPNLGIDPIEAVVERKTEFAVAEGSKVIEAIAAGQPIVAIGTDYQTSPVVVFALKEKGIAKPEDLVGKTLKISPTTHGAYASMMNKLGIDMTQVQEISKTSGATRGANYLDDIKDGTFDASEGYLINQPLRLQQLGYEVVILPVSDFGVQSYSDVIITHRDILEDDPELVKSFIEATREGWLYALNNIEETAEVVVGDYRPGTNVGTTVSHEKALLEASRSLVMPGAASEVLSMSEDVWASMTDDLKQLGVLESDVSANSIFINL
jgi:ABC-type nitrate/sulfonate/bicarbonate transport system substrate-binding protein